MKSLDILRRSHYWQADPDVIRTHDEGKLWDLPETVWATCWSEIVILLTPCLLSGTFTHFQYHLYFIKLSFQWEDSSSTGKERRGRLQNTTLLRKPCGPCKASPRPRGWRRGGQVSRYVLRRVLSRGSFWEDALRAIQKFCALRAHMIFCTLWSFGLSSPPPLKKCLSKKVRCLLFHSGERGRKIVTQLSCEARVWRSSLVLQIMLIGIYCSLCTS